MSRTATGLDSAALQRLSGAVQLREYARRFSIHNPTDVEYAVKGYERTGKPAALKTHIVKRTEELGLKNPFDGDDD